MQKARFSGTVRPKHQSQRADWDVLRFSERLKIPQRKTPKAPAERSGQFIPQLVLQVLTGNPVEAAGGHTGSGDAKFLGLRQRLLSFDSKFLGDVVDADGHKWVSLSS